MLLGQLGKLTFKLFDKDIDRIKLDEFCKKCKLLGYENNSSLEKMKVDKMNIPYGQYFVGLTNDEIFTIAGVHNLSETGIAGWRCLFRGAQLPGHTPTWSMDIFKSGIHFSYLLYYQIKFVQQFEPLADFYISTNIDNPSAGASSRLNSIMMPRLASKGYWDLTHENIQLYGTSQNLWKVNVEKYMEDREIWLAGDMNTD